MRRKQEWDYPPEQRRYRILDTVPEGKGWGSPKVTSAISIYWFIIKMIFCAFVGVSVTVLIWFLTLILKA